MLACIKEQRSVAVSFRLHFVSTEKHCGPFRRCKMVHPRSVATSGMHSVITELRHVPDSCRIANPTMGYLIRSLKLQTIYMDRTLLCQGPGSIQKNAISSLVGAEMQQ